MLLLFGGLSCVAYGVVTGEQVWGSAYTANLTSILTTNTVKLSVNSIQVAIAVTISQAVRADCHTHQLIATAESIIWEALQFPTF